MYGPVRGRGVDAPMPQSEQDGAAPTSQPQQHRVPTAAQPDVNELTEADVRDLSTKLVDLRGLVRPAPFTRRREDWAEFRFRLESAATLM
eukprot:13869892-Heterocapsa_arctica.AAC.1